LKRSPQRVAVLFKRRTGRARCEVRVEAGPAGLIEFSIDPGRNQLSI